MALYKTEVELVHPVTQVLTPVTLYVEGGSQSYADAVSDLLLELTSFAGKAAELRALAAALIVDIDSKA